jgi:hypothetical protein
VFYPGKTASGKLQLKLGGTTTYQPRFRKEFSMFRKVMTLAGVALCLSLPAMAQQTTQSSSTDSTSTIGSPVPGMSTSSIRNHLMQDLEKAGYTDVNIVPASFVAQAKDKQGHPVTMLISPDSFTTITEVPQSPSNSAKMSTSKASGTETSTASNK